MEKSGSEEDVCEILGFKNINQTLLDRVKKAYKTNLKSLKMAQTSCATLNPDNHGKAVYISEPGLYQLIFSSRLESADAFRTWVFEDVLPSIRKTGNYEIQALKNELRLKSEEHQKELNKAMEQLAIKDDEIAKKDEKLKGAEKTALQLKNFIETVNLRQRNEWIYE